VEKQIDALMEAVDKYIPQPAASWTAVLMPMKTSFSIQGRGTVVTGRIEDVGKVKWARKWKSWASATRARRLSQA